MFDGQLVIVVKEGHMFTWLCDAVKKNHNYYLNGLRGREHFSRHFSSIHHKFWDGSIFFRIDKTQVPPVQQLSDWESVGGWSFGKDVLMSLLNTSSDIPLPSRILQGDTLYVVEDLGKVRNGLSISWWLCKREKLRDLYEFWHSYRCDSVELRRYEASEHLDIEMQIVVKIEDGEHIKPDEYSTMIALGSHPTKVTSKTYQPLEGCRSIIYQPSGKQKRKKRRR